MAIPKYREMYKPFLECISDGKQHTYKEIREYIASAMLVSTEDQKTMLLSGKQTVFDNRVAWAKAHLKKAGLVESPSRAITIITTEGKKVLQENPPIINNDYLLRYESFRIFRHRSDSPDSSISTSRDDDDTPQDVLDKAVGQINANLVDELLTETVKQPPDFFERLVVNLLTKMGYGGSVQEPGVITGQSRDEGIDGIIREDKLGFSLIYTSQAMGHRANCRTSRNSEVCGSVSGTRGNKGSIHYNRKIYKGCDFLCRQTTRHPCGWKPFGAIDD
jgi:restriction system protein